ncbi:hypothetical protein NDN08_005342 [Rhodosorus marinus]|uniref:Peptidylprolyl isomerase n=1 Tax=Rhodosorus marinus TaxID=101924 RepID=A0AAV8V4N1_9RHOD|nr:hypothetical protein NDN08_005342 [Rhodosorus marinus]
MGCRVLVVLVVAAVALQYAAVGGALTQVDFEDVPVAEGIPGLPTDFAFMPPGQTERILVTDFRGMVQVVVKGAVQEKLFLDERVSQEERDNFIGYGNFGDRGIAPEYRAVADQYKFPCKGL